MPNELALTDDKALHASGAEVSSGTGSAIEIGDRSFVELTLNVTAISGSLQVTVETSATQAGWVLAGRFAPVTTTDTWTFIVPDAKPFLRAKWTITGSATFGLTGAANQLYVKPNDVSEYLSALNRNALAGIEVKDIAKSCLAASAEAEVYLSSAYDLPVTSLDAATRRHIAAMAAYDLFRFRSSQTASNGSLEIGRSEAIAWLGKVSQGKLKPTGVVDATPGNDAPGVGGSGGTSTSPFVVAGVTRGWGR